MGQVCLPRGLFLLWCGPGFLISKFHLSTISHYLRCRDVAAIIFNIGSFVDMAQPEECLTYERVAKRIPDIFIVCMFRHGLGILDSLKIGQSPNHV